jgi:hypothetical protein
MRFAPGGPDEAKRRLRAHAQEQAALLVPRPGYPIYGLSSPALASPRVSEYSSWNGGWTSVTLSYGQPGAQSGPRVTVTTTAHGDGMVSEPTWEPRPDAVARHNVDNVTVTVATWGVPMDTVRTEPVPDLRPLIEAAAEETIARIERRLREPKPPPAPPPPLPPAEGVAALRALADFSLATHREVRARRAPRHPPDWGRMHSALWQRAVRERQRLGGVSAQAADEDVTSAVNHLGQLLEHAPWFEADARLREAAVDETLRHAMLGEAVPSAAAQRAWTAYWSAHRSGAGPAMPPEAVLAGIEAGEALLDNWRAAWAAWAARSRLPAPADGGFEEELLIALRGSRTRVVATVVGVTPVSAAPQPMAVR